MEKKTNKVQVVTRIDPDLKESIKSLAKEKKRNFSNCIEWLLSIGVENENKPKID